MFSGDSQDKIMMKVRLYTRRWCSWCLDAKEYLQQRQIPFTEIDVGRDPVADAEMQRLSSQRYVPTIIVNDRVLANFDVGQLERFLAQVNPPPASPAR